jgi:hypothetical protein
VGEGRKKFYGANYAKKGGDKMKKIDHLFENSFAEVSGALQGNGAKLTLEAAIQIKSILLTYITQAFQEGRRDAFFQVMEKLNPITKEI